MYLNQINFTRFIAAISVVIFHYGLGVKPFKNFYLQKFFITGNLFVLYFFILSGIILSIAYKDNINRISLKNFILKRLGRIYPVFFLSIAISFTFELVTSGIPNIIHLLKILSLTHGWINPWVDSSGRLYNPPAWTLSLEFFFYLSYPIIFSFLQNKKNIVLYFTIFLCLTYNYIIQTQLFRLNEFIKSFIPHPIYYLQTFLIGICLGLLFTRNIFSKNELFKNQNSISFILVLIIYLYLIIYLDMNMNNSSAIIFSFALIIWLIAMDQSILSKIFSIKILKFLGDISFGIYILQYPVKKIYDYLFEKSFSYHPTSYFYFYLFILIIISSISYTYFEKPLLSKLKSYISKD